VAYIALGDLYVRRNESTKARAARNDPPPTSPGPHPDPREIAMSPDSEKIYFGQATTAASESI